MKKNLLDYVKKYSVVPHDLCDSIVAEISTAEWQQHYFYNAKSNEYANISGNKELWTTGYQPTNSANLTNCIKESIRNYVNDVNSLVWDGPTSVSITRFNRYQPGQTMAIHADHIHTLFDGERKGIPVITILSVLNDNYTGGEFIMFEDTLIKVNKGDVLVFPSIFLYPHKVLPVKSGTRYTCVNWAW